MRTLCGSLILAGIVAVFLLAMVGCSSKVPGAGDKVQGIVQRTPTGGWGINMGISHGGKLAIANLPAQYQRVGLHIECKITHDDVIGTDGWGHIADVENVRALPGH